MSVVMQLPLHILAMLEIPRQAFMAGVRMTVTLPRTCHESGWGSLSCWASAARLCIEHAALVVLSLLFNSLFRDPGATTQKKSRLMHAPP